MARANLANAKQSFVKEDGTLTKYGKDLLDQILEELGLPGSSTISELQLGEVFETSKSIHNLDEILDEIRDDSKTFHIKEIHSTTVTGDYTSAGNEYINAKGSITIKLPAYPGDDDVVYVRCHDGLQKTIDGNGNNILVRDAETTFRFSNKGRVLKMIFNPIELAWVFA